MQHRYKRWETTSRYYSARVYTDLLGDTIVACAWGGLHNNIGNSDHQAVADIDTALDRLEEIGKRRASHRYIVVVDKTTK